MKGNSLLLASSVGSFAFLCKEVVMSHQALDFTPSWFLAELTLIEWKSNRKWISVQINAVKEGWVENDTRGMETTGTGLASAS